jgi:hypothetical protein
MRLLTSADRAWLRMEFSGSRLRRFGTVLVITIIAPFATILSLSILPREFAVWAFYLILSALFALCLGAIWVDPSEPRQFIKTLPLPIWRRWSLQWVSAFVLVALPTVVTAFTLAYPATRSAGGPVAAMRLLTLSGALGIVISLVFMWVHRLRAEYRATGLWVSLVLLSVPLALMCVIGGILWAFLPLILLAFWDSLSTWRSFGGMQHLPFTAGGQGHAWNEPLGTMARWYVGEMRQSLLVFAAAYGVWLCAILWIENPPEPTDFAVFVTLFAAGFAGSAIPSGLHLLGYWRGDSSALSFSHALPIPRQATLRLLLTLGVILCLLMCVPLTLVCWVAHFRWANFSLWEFLGWGAAALWCGLGLGTWGAALGVIFAGRETPLSQDELGAVFALLLLGITGAVVGAVIGGVLGLALILGLWSLTPWWLLPHLDWEREV